jgi:hypothetical protein
MSKKAGPATHARAYAHAQQLLAKDPSSAEAARILHVLSFRTDLTKLESTCPACGQLHKGTGLSERCAKRAEAIGTGRAYYSRNTVKANMATAGRTS